MEERGGGVDNRGMSPLSTVKGELRSAIVRYFAARGEVVAAYRLPDALRHPSAGPSSIDVAVLLHPLVDQCRYEEFRLELAEGLAVEVNRPDVRVLVLNDASPNLGYDILRVSDPLYLGSEDVVAEFEARIQAEFLRSVHDRAVPRRHSPAPSR
ncbi:MAG: hypothetical protein ABIH26_06275 [Candidatus Eisenbacteria bacterium]